MRLSRFFIDTPLSLGDHELPEAQAHYIGRVLRMAEGDAVQVFDGSGQEFRGTLAEVGKKRVRVQLDEQFGGQPESPLRIHLGQGLSRGERMDWAIQKATELGVTQITPIFSERCEVRLKDERADKRLLHWRQVAISACEQCGRSGTGCYGGRSPGKTGSDQYHEQSHQNRGSGKKSPGEKKRHGEEAPPGCFEIETRQRSGQDQIAAGKTRSQPAQGYG